MCICSSTRHQFGGFIPKRGIPESFIHIIYIYAASGKESACQWRRCRRCKFNLSVRKIPWSRKWQHAPVFLPRKFQGQTILVGYSPWSCKESNTTEHTHTHTHTRTHIPMGLPGSSAGKESTSSAGDPGSIPELGRSSGE